jgi:hypothetical protein
LKLLIYFSIVILTKVRIHSAQRFDSNAPFGRMDPDFRQGDEAFEYKRFLKLAPMGQTPRAPRHLASRMISEDRACREAPIKPAAHRTCPQFELKREADMNGVWGPRPQKTYYNSNI